MSFAWKRVCVTASSKFIRNGEKSIPGKIRLTRKKLSVCFIKDHNMKKYRGVKV